MTAEEALKFGLIDSVVTARSQSGEDKDKKDKK